MAAFRLSRRAETDLLDIATYTLRNWGQDQAVHYVDDLEDCCRKLAANPALGRACGQVRPGLRRMEHAQHVLFYRIEVGGIVVTRILHKRMLPERHSIGEED